MSQDIIETGICSFGMSGMVFHAPLLEAHPGFNIKSILERSKNLSEGKYNSTIVRSLDEIINDDMIELVIVNTPDHLHYDMTKEALLAGKHVVVEKPFTLTSSKGEELIDLSRSKNLVLSVFQNRRWDGDFLTVKKVISDQLLGRLVEFETHFDRYRNYIQDSWKEDDLTGTGTIYNLGSHLIDQALVLFGMPQSVFADIRILRTGGKIDDSFDILLKYAEIKVLLKAGYLIREPGARFSLHGTLGSYIKHGLDPQEEALKNGIQPSTQGWGIEDKSSWGLLSTDMDGVHVKKKFVTLPGNYLAYYDNIYEAIRKGTPLEVPAQEGLDVIRVIEAAIESNKTGKVIKPK